MNVKGSLQAAQAIASSIKTLLGPSHSTKCCINGEDDRDVIICSSAAKILQYLEVEHPVGYIINDACQAMHKTDGCGCKTLVCMIGFWSRSALTLQHEGVPVSIISKLFDEALFNCFQVLEEISLPIQETINERSKDGDMPSKIQTSSHEDSSSIGPRPSRFIIEKVWITTEDDINKGDVVHTSDDDGSLALSLSTDGNENKTETQNLVAKLPKSNKTLNKMILMEDSQCCSVITGNPSRESLIFDDTVEDEFDSCFDDLPVSVGTSQRKLVNKESGGVCRPASSSEQKARENNTKPITNISTNKSELEKMDQMLKDLSFSGQKVISPKVSTSKKVSEILKSCRNFSIDSPKTQREEESYQAQEDSKGSFNLDFIGKEDLERLGKMLSHGKDKVMALAVEVIFHQISSSRKNMNLNRFDVDENSINIERIIGPTSGHSQVVFGIFLQQKAHLVGDFPLGALCVALVNGDITEEFRHAGFKDSFQTKRVFNEDSYKHLSTSNTSWLQRILNVLRRLEIGVVIARGNIDKDLEDSCQALKIQTFAGISPKTLQLLSHSLSSTAVVYLSDLKESHVGKLVFLHQWNGPQPQMTNDNEVLLVLKLAENQSAQITLQQSGRNPHGLKENMKESKEDQEPLQTVLLCGPSEQLVMDLELSFWNCVFCLRNTINCGCILPGAGRTEMTCIQKLRKISENPGLLKDKPSKSSSWLQMSLSSYRPAVYTAFADGLVEFLINLLSNSGCMMNYGQAYTVIQEALGNHDHLLSGWQYPHVADNFIAKKNAWSKAIGVVCLMLQSDMAIITGDQASTN